MSEFTDGILFLARHLPQAEEVVSTIGQPYILRSLTDKWGVIFPNMDNMLREEFRSWLMKASERLPLLFFEHPEDHGWGYQVFNGGKQTASLHVSYETAYHLARELAETRYPASFDVHALSHEIWDELYEAVYQSASYAKAIRQQYQNRNFGALAVFDISASVIDSLEKTISAEDILHNRSGMLEQVQYFKQQLGIETLSWMSYHYLSGQ